MTLRRLGVKPGPPVVGAAGTSRNTVVGPHRSTVVMGAVTKTGSPQGEAWPTPHTVMGAVTKIGSPRAKPGPPHTR